MRDYLLLILIFTLGFFFRLWFISLSPQPIIGDQGMYLNYAKEWLAKGGVYAWWFRTYAYPLFILLIFRFAQVDNLSAVFAVQAAVDSLTGVLLFFIAVTLYRRRSIAWLIALLYAFNPYTSGYVGVVLTEVLAAFLVVLFFLIFALLVKERKVKLVYLLFASLVVSYLAQVRPAFLTWSILSLGVIFIRLLPKAKSGKRLAVLPGKMRYYLLMIAVVTIGYLVPASYSLYSNWLFFKQISPTTVIGLAREFYIGTFVKDFPVFALTPQEVHPQLPQVYSEMWVYPNYATAQRRLAVQNKFLRLAWQNIAQDPLDYLWWRVKKMVRLWEREKLFFYVEPNLEKHDHYFLWYNRLLVLLAILAIVKQLTSREKGAALTFARMTAFTLIYSTLLFSLTIGESRLTIPLFPLVVFYSGVGTSFSKRLVLARLQGPALRG